MDFFYVEYCHVCRPSQVGCLFMGNEIIRVYDQRVVVYMVWPFYALWELGYKYENLGVYEK